MSSTKKTRGSTDERFCNASPSFFAREDGTQLATLVVFPGPREEVFTASEVRALLRELEEADHFGPYQHDVLAKHGLTI